MKNLHSLLLAAGITALAGFAPAPAQAEPAPAAAAAPAAAPLYAFVDMNRVLYQCDAGKELRAELTRKGQKIEGELQAENKTLSQAAMDFKKAKESMPADSPELQKKSKDLQARYDAADRMLQNRKMTLNAAVNSSNKQLSNDAVEIIAKIMKEKGYTAVFSHEAVVLAAENQDITAEVLRRLNETVKTIPVDWKAASQAGE